MKIFHTVNCNLFRTNEVECVENLNFPHIIIDLQSTSYDLDVEYFIYIVYCQYVMYGLRESLLAKLVYVDCEVLNIIRLACVYDLKKKHTNHEYRIGLCGLCGSYIIVWFLYLTHHLGESVEVVGTVYEFTAFVVEKEDGYFRDVVFQSVG